MKKISCTEDTTVSNKAIVDEYVEALDHIRRVARAGRSQSRRDLWISARADSALNGDDNWRIVDYPRTKLSKFRTRSYVEKLEKCLHDVLEIIEENPSMDCLESIQQLCEEALEEND